MSGIIFTCWKVRDMPRAAISRDFNPLMAWPRNSTRPVVSAATPVIRLKVVDLPAPLGPMSPTICPAWI